MLLDIVHLSSPVWEQRRLERRERVVRRQLAKLLASASEVASLILPTRISIWRRTPTLSVPALTPHWRTSSLGLCAHTNPHQHGARRIHIHRSLPDRFRADTAQGREDVAAALTTLVEDDDLETGEVAGTVYCRLAGE